MDKDYVIYIILFSLISIGTYRSDRQNEQLKTSVKNLEQTCVLLTIQKKQADQRIDFLQRRLDSLYLHKYK
jgi:hypothetical protein